MVKKYKISKTLFLHEKNVIEKSLHNIKTDVDFSNDERAEIKIDHTIHSSKKLPQDSHKLRHIFCEILGLGHLPADGELASVGKEMPGDQGRRYFAKLQLVSENSYQLSLRCRADYSLLTSKEGSVSFVTGLGHEMQGLFAILTEKAHRHIKN